MKRVISFMLLFLMCFTVCMPVSVFADPTPPPGTQNVGTVGGKTGDNETPPVPTTGNLLSIAIKDSKLKEEINKYFGSAAAASSAEWTVQSKGTPVVLGGLTEGAFSIKKTEWNSLKDSERSKAMRKLVDNLSATVDPDVMQDFMSRLQEQDTSVASVMLPLIFDSTKGDMYQAYKITSPFLNILSVVLGVGAVLLILLLLFSTVMDLAYIGLPVWREANANKEGGDKQPFGVSYEALTTVKSVEKDLGGGDYKNAYVLYFKRRALTYIILAVCIMYLIGGGLSGIIGFILSLVSGITG